MNYALQEAVRYFFTFLYFAILARVILSWFPMARGNVLVRWLYAVTEPILGPIRAIIEKSPLGGPGMILDFSPIIAFLLINVLQNLLLSLLRSM